MIIDLINEPLIWTNRGNLPAKALTFDVKWTVTPEYTSITQTYSYEGEIVRSDVHAIAHEGHGLSGQLAETT